MLAKPQLDNAILVEELLAVMENFGIGEEEESHLEKPSGEQIRKRKPVDLGQLEDDAFMLLFKLGEYLQ